MWEVKTYTVTYDANGGTGAPENQTKTYGETLTLSSTKPTRTGYSFVGWATSNTATTAEYQPGGSYTKNASVTLYAVWEVKTYTVMYDANGGTGAPENQTKTYGETLTLSSTKPTRTGYSFVGWATSNTATTAEYQPGGSYTKNASVTLYAVWEVKTYTVMYDANGGTGAPENQTKTYGETLTLSSTKPTRTGYTFAGWATSNTAATAAYQPGGSYTKNASVTLYAVWEKGVSGVWKKSSGGWWYQFEDGTYPASQMLEIDGKKYYFNSSGYLYTGWKQVDGKWYYFTSSGAVTGWKKISGVWYWFDADGVMATGLQSIDGAYYYFKASGAMATGWQQIGSYWYYFEASGAMRKSSWLKSGGSWYWLNANGRMVTGWATIDGVKYYFNSSGAMVTGWQEIGGSWYYFKDGGAMTKSEWLKSGGYWYWLDANGKMAVGWKQIDGEWYYFYSGGKMAASTYVDDYWIDAGGVRRYKVDTAYKSAYLTVLKNNKSAINQSNLLNSYASKTVSLGDINADGIPELMFLCNGGSLYNYKIYTYYNGKAVEVFSEPCVIFYGGLTTLAVYVSKDGKSLYFYSADGDEGYHGEDLSEYELSGGELKKVRDLQWSIDPSGKEKFSKNGSGVGSSAYKSEFSSMVNDCSVVLFARAGGVGRDAMWSLIQNHTSTATTYTGAVNALS